MAAVGHAPTHGIGHARCRRLLDHLLVAPLQGTVALEEMDDIAEGVGEDLHLDMARSGEIFLDKDSTVAEGGERLALRGSERRREIGSRIDLAHAATATTHHRLDEHGVADLVGSLQGAGVLPFTLIARHDGHTRRTHQKTFAASLAPIASIDFADGPMNTRPAASTSLAKAAFSGEKAVARMNRLRPSGLRRGDDALGLQMKLSRAGAGPIWICLSASCEWRA